jgi:hypothetical protein
MAVVSDRGVRSIATLLSGVGFLVVACPPTDVPASTALGMTAAGGRLVRRVTGQLSAMGLARPNAVLWVT